MQCYILQEGIQIDVPESFMMRMKNGLRNGQVAPPEKTTESALSIQAQHTIHNTLWSRSRTSYRLKYHARNI